MENSVIDITTIKAGGIFVACWGYGMTLYDYVQVTKVSGSRVYYRKLKEETIGGEGYGQPCVRAIPNEFDGEEHFCKMRVHPETKEITFKASPSGDGSVTGYLAWFHKWDFMTDVEDHND